MPACQFAWSWTRFSCCAEAFAQHHASQCGYCTPGFVVACHAALAKAEAQGKQAKTEDLMQGLDGNLCRCTGYQPIIDACKVNQWILYLLSLWGVM